MNANPGQDTNELNEEDRFVYKTNTELPSLEELASCRVTLAVWNSYISRLKYARPRSKGGYDNFKKCHYLFDSYEKDSEKLVEDLRTPTRIESSLKTCLQKVRSKMKECFDHFTSLSNRYGDDANFYSNSDWCVWFPNGEIDYRKTAQKIISVDDGRLNEVQKCIIMCDCCLEDEARILLQNPLVDDMVHLKAQTGNDSSFRRWLAYLGNKHSERYVINCGELGNMATSWPYAGLVAECDINCTSNVRINHYWHSLTDDDQVLAVYKLITTHWFSADYDRWQIVEPLIGSMSSIQQRSLLSMPDAALTIVNHSWKYSSSSDCTVWAWKYCRDFISSEQFDGIFNMRCHNTERNLHAVSNLEKIWDMASDPQKNHLVSYRNSYEPTFLSFVITLHERYYRAGDLTSTAYELFAKYVAEIESPEERVSFIIQYSIQLAMGTNDIDNLNRIFHYHVPCPSDQLQFKTFVLNSKYMVQRCSTLWRSGNFDVLNANLKFYLNDDAKASRNYLQNVFKSIVSDYRNFDDASKCVITDANKWTECSQYIDQVFPNNRAKASIAKKQFVSHFLALYPTPSVLYKKFNQAVKIIESVYSNKADIKRLKSEFLSKESSIFLKNDKCDDEYFHNVIQWCCKDNDEAIDIIKKIYTSPGDLFDKVFYQLNKTYVTEAKGLKVSLLDHLDEYLSWILVDEQRVSEYKELRFNNSARLRIFSTIRRQKDESSFQILLEWFFNGDYAKIREFKWKKMKY